MAEPQDIHQLEYRWQAVTDMSPIAGSMSAESARLWVQRIGVWVRHPSVDAPAESVRYEVFANGAAALAWRLRDRRAAETADPRGGRPLVSRVLVGPADLLTPEAAAAVCYEGLPEAIGPRPGAVAGGAALPPVPAQALTGLAERTAAVLDEAAAREQGLDLVVAAALGDRDTALCVQLPERDVVRSPCGNSQAALLWGLRRTVWPILGRGGRRGWSFSTFEPPLSDMDPGALPDIVFRLAQAASRTAPQATRREIRVRPQDPLRAPPATLPQQLARLLVTAYAELGGDELSRLITRAVAGKSSADHRIEAAYNALDSGMSAVTVSTDTPRRPPDPPISTAGPVTARPPTATTTRPPAPVTPAISSIPPAPIIPAGPVLAAPPPPAPAPPAPARSPAGWADVSVGRPPQDAPPLVTDHDRRAPAEPVSLPGNFSGLLALLAKGPGSQGFEPALHALRATNFQSAPDDRAVARRLVLDHGWYLDVLKQQDQAPPGDVLVLIFWHAVIPDLADPQVARELTYWIREAKAPETVVRALYIAATGAAGSPQRMEQVIGPALAWRWRAEHGIQLPPVPSSPRAPYSPAAAAPPEQQSPPAEHPQTLLTLLERKVTIPVPLVLAILIAIVVLFLATPR